MRRRGGTWRVGVVAVLFAAGCTGGLHAGGDAATDAATAPDAPRADAGRLDGGARDASSGDAGARDAAVTEGGGFDAAIGDGGSGDAGRPDAGSADAGARDAGPAPDAGYGGLYGVPWNGDGLSDLSPGRPDGVIDYRFRAPHTGSVTGLRIYLIFAHLSTDCTYSGHYAGGTGGRILIQLETDDGSSAHVPSGTVLTSYTITNPLQNDPRVSSGVGSLLEYTFATPAPITAGQLYHFVFSDVDADPTCNWTDIDNLYVPANTPDVQPAVSDTDFAILKRSGTGPWAIDYRETPIFNMYYADGTTFGQGFIYRNPGYHVQGTNEVRETMTVSGASVTFSRVFVRASATGSPGPMTVTVETDAGTVIDSGTFTAASIDAKGWGSVRFASSHVLASGSTYDVVLSAPADGSNDYLVWPLQAGTAYGMDPPNTFPDGHFQFTTDGSTWNDYPTRRTDFDLQLYLAP